MTDLKNAIEYLGAVEIGQGSDPDPAFDRFAMQTPSGRWHTFSRATLERFASGVLNNVRYQVTIGRAFALMPEWWTPTRQVVEKAWIPGSPVSQYYPLMNAIFHGCAPSTVTAVTADTESGEEVAVPSQEGYAARQKTLRAAPMPTSKSPSF